MGENNNTWHQFRILISVLVTLLFVSSLSAINRIEKSKNADWSVAMNQLYEQNQLLRNQRNVWICGICLLLTFLQYRLQSMAHSLYESRKVILENKKNNSKSGIINNLENNNLKVQ